MTPREWRRSVAKVATELGWTVEWTRSSHLRLTKPGRVTVFTSGSSSDRRAIKNLRAQLVRCDQGRSPSGGKVVKR